MREREREREREMDGYLLVGLWVITFMAQLSFAVTSFGRSIIFQIGYHVLGVIRLTSSESLADALAYISVVNLVATPYQSFSLRKHNAEEKLNWKMILLLYLPMLPSLFLGIELLVLLEDSVWLKRSAGVFFLLIALHRMWNLYFNVNDPHGVSNSVSQSRRETFTWSFVIAGILAGFLSGFLSGVIGAGGPPLMVFVELFNLEKNEVRVCLTMTWLLMEPVRAFMILYLKRKFESDIWYAYLSMMIAALLALECGNRVIAPRVSKLVFSKCILMFLILGGLLMSTSKTPVTKYVAVCAAIALIVISMLWYLNQRKSDGADVVDVQHDENRGDGKVKGDGRIVVELRRQQSSV